MPSLFPQTVSDKIKDWAKGSINGQLAFSSTGLSFFKHFPSLTLTLYDFSLKGSVPFQKDTLVSAKEVSLGIELSSVFQKKITISKIYLNDAFINVQVDSAGHANYNVYKAKDNTPKTPADTASASLGINQILIEKSHLVYNDLSMPMRFEARDFNYNGKSDFSKNIFDLYTHTEMGAVDFLYNNQHYLFSKKVNADLITKINAKSLAFIFQKNDLLINELPVQFTGRFGFLKNGYDMDFKIVSHESNLHDIITALPPDYVKWLHKTELHGTGNIQLELAGKYIAADSIMPNLNLDIKVRNGFINNEKSPLPITNLYLNFSTRVPGLDPDSLQLHIDSMYFNMGKDYFSSVIRVHGVKKPDIFAKINTEIDLEKWESAFGLKPVKLKGRYSLHLLAQGMYASGIRRTGTIRKRVDTVITSIPKFTLTSSFKDGYFKYSKYEALKNISFNINANCPDNNYQHTNFSIENLNANALDNFIKGYFKMTAAPGFPMDGDVHARFNLADINKFYPLEVATLTGILVADLQTKGRYLPKKSIFPVAKANISLQNGSIQTKYYPHPIHDIKVEANIYDNTGSLKGLKVAIKPVSFVFEDKPFTLKADLKNFDNMEYNVVAAGTLDIGKIYKVFAIKGYDVNGTIKANINLKGKQSDATAGNFDKLSNSGTLQAKDVAVSTELFPKPFLIKYGTFTFNQDKMQFDTFKATYGKSVIIINGALSNVIAFATKPGSVLKGDFNFTSPNLIADDFMAFSSPSPTQSGKPAAGPSGVIMVPGNLNLNFIADAKKVIYNGLTINDAQGQMTIANGALVLKQTGFTLIGAPVVMDATYTSINPKSATFDYHINAKEFDIKKAYNGIKLFHDMASSAKDAEGVVSLDYKLAGKLNSNMQPVYPSLKGGGVLSVKKVKLKGFKLFGAVGSKTNHNGLDSGDVSKVDMETTIANNIITIKRTKMRMAGFRLRFEGQVSFNNELNLHFRLGLPPLGILGIPMTITGTQAKPIIKLGNGDKEDDLKETTDEGGK